MTAEVVAPAKPICLTCIATPVSGADTNVSVLSITEYDLVVDESVGYCVTPSSVTKTSLLEGTSLERLNVVVDPSPVNYLLYYLLGQNLVQFHQ